MVGRIYSAYRRQAFVHRFWKEMRGVLEAGTLPNIESLLSTGCNGRRLPQKAGLRKLGGILSTCWGRDGRYGNQGQSRRTAMGIPTKVVTAPVESMRRRCKDIKDNQGYLINERGGQGRQHMNSCAEAMLAVETHASNETEPRQTCRAGPQGWGQGAGLRIAPLCGRD